MQSPADIRISRTRHDARSRGSPTRSKEHMRIDALERPSCHRVAQHDFGGPQPDDVIIRKAKDN